MRAVLCFLLTGWSFTLMAQLVNIESQRLQTDSVRLAGQVDGSFSYQQVNDKKISIINFGTTIQGKSKNLKHILLILADYRQTRANNTEFANAGFSHLRYNYKVNKWLRIEQYNQWQYNELLAMKTRILHGGGVRIKPYKSDNLYSYIGIGGFYEYEETEEGMIIYRNDVRLSNYVTFGVKLPNKRGQFNLVSYYQPLTLDFSDFRLTCQAQLNLNLLKKLSLQTSFNYLYDSRPPIGIAEQTLRFSTGLAWEF